MQGQSSLEGQGPAVNSRRGGEATRRDAGALAVLREVQPAARQLGLSPGPVTLGSLTPCGELLE